MAAPNDPNDKPKVTLDLDLQQSPKAEPKPEQKPKENTQIKFRQGDAPAKRQEKPQAAAPNKPMRPPQYRTKTGKKPRKSGTSRPLFIGAGVLIIAVLLAQYFGTGDLPMTQAPNPTPKMSAKATKAVPTETLPKTPPPASPAGDPYAGLREANLDQLDPTVDDDGNTFFAVRIAPKLVCHPADVEAMRNAVGNTGKLLLSLEPMADNAKMKAPISRTLSVKELTQGSKLSLPVNLKEPGVYGIYICSDEAGKRSCSGKPAADFNKIFNHRDLDIAANSVFYYQFTVLGLDYATVYSGMPSSIAGAREQLEERRSKRDWKPELEKAAGIMRGVKSFPPRTIREGNTVILELPVAMVNPDGSCR
jgi:hypothetical protein